MVHLDGVIDHQVGRQQRVGAIRVGAHGGQRVAHGGQVHHAGYAGEILQQHARRHEADFLGIGALTAGDQGHVIGRDPAAVFVPQQVLEKNLGGEREARHMAHTRFFEARETKALVLCVPYAQLCRRAEAIFRH